MTVTFENENDIIVYVLEKIICYARDNHYICVAQSVWWIASIIGLPEGLATHIDNLRLRFDASHLILEDNQLSSGKDLPNKLLEHCNTEIQESHIHPDRIFQVGKVSEDPEDDNRQPELDRASDIVQSTKRFLERSRKERAALKQKACVLSRTRSGKIPVKPLTKKQRNQLQAIPKETLSAYITGRQK